MSGLNTIESTQAKQKEQLEQEFLLQIFLWLMETLLYVIDAKT